ncbi:MAG: hypothetical protein V4621_07970 [Pseudomonadota bacterium]
MTNALEEEILKLHRELAAERLRADQGWQRYEEANRDRMALRLERVQLTCEAQHNYETIQRQGELLEAAVNVLRGPPPMDSSWSHHDIAELCQRAMNGEVVNDQKTYYATFGMNQTLGRSYVKLAALNAADARAQLHLCYGTRWAFLYNAEDFESKIARHGLTEVGLGTPNEYLEGEDGTT